MDAVFFLEEEARAAFLNFMGTVLHCSYVCLWSCPSHPSNLLICKDAWYNEENDDPLSSAAVLLRSLFDAYRRTVIDIQTGYVPGHVSMERLPYLELAGAQLLGLAVNETQRLFYQEAGIKVAAFLGCKSGEIELGISNPRNVNLQMEVKNLMAEIMPHSQLGELGLPGQSRPSSSSSSLMSLSMGSPECSSLFHIPPSSSYVPERASKPSSSPVLPLYGRTRAGPFPQLGADDAIMTRAMLSVISSPPSPSSSNSLQMQQTRSFRQGAGAFRRYISGLRPKLQTAEPNQPRHSMVKRALALLRSIPRVTAEPSLQESRSTTNQLHHMISERRRREKLNEFFHALRGLLPPGIKRDKASVLSGTIETLGALKGEILELKKKMELLEGRVSPPKAAVEEEAETSNERVRVKISEASESSSEEREIQLQVEMREDVCTLSDLIIRLLECLKRMNNVRMIVSLEGRMLMRQLHSFNQVTIRLRVQMLFNWNANQLGSPD